jgi:hypothetical protein
MLLFSSYTSYSLACSNSALTSENTVAYLLKARTVEPEKQQLLGNGRVTRNNGVTVGSGVLCAVCADAIRGGPAVITGEF